MAFPRTTRWACPWARSKKSPNSWGATTPSPKRSGTPAVYEARLLASFVDDPALVNRDSAGEGWFFKLALADTAAFDALLDEDAYNAFLETL